MAKKRKHGRPKDKGEGERKATPAPERVFSSPFKDLKKMLAERERTVPKVPVAMKLKAAVPVAASVVEKSEPVVADVIDDESFLRQALQGVRPLHRNGNAR